MATAFDFANIAILSLLSYARDAYGEQLSLGELADSIDAEGEDFFANNKSDEQDQNLTIFSATALANAFRELESNGYTFDDLLTSVTNVLPEEAFNEITSEDDDEEDSDDEDLDEEDEEDEDEDDEEEDDLEEEDDEEDEEDDEEEDDLEEEDEDDEEDDEDDEEDDLDEDDSNY